MQPNRMRRVFKALHRKGLNVSRRDGVYTVELSGQCALPARVLLPDGFPLEAKALRQLALLAGVRHPEGSAPVRVVATPDFHPGDSGVAIGSVAASKDMVIPAAVGSDINCGMRLHVVDLDVGRFLAHRKEFVELMKGDYFFGTRDVVMDKDAFANVFSHGLSGWLISMMDTPKGIAENMDLNQLSRELDLVFSNGSMSGHPQWAPESLITRNGPIRDDGLATIGGGNHFVELQWVEEILDATAAWRLGIKVGQVAWMIHSGSRTVGKYVGHHWKHRVKEVWPPNNPHPEGGLFPLVDPKLINAYLQAEATAANYGFVNRMLLAELMRQRMRQVFGDLEGPLIADVPHNLTLRERDCLVSRKGACPAYDGQPVIIPGSMGAASYLLLGKGNMDFLCSASHGAGRMKSRFAMSRRGADKSEEAMGLRGVDCITLRDERRIEEAPAAYKPIQPVIDIQVRHGLVTPVARLQPLLTFKA